MSRGNSLSMLKYVVCLFLSFMIFSLYFSRSYNLIPEKNLTPKFAYLTVPANVSGGEEVTANGRVSNVSSTAAVRILVYKPRKSFKRFTLPLTYTCNNQTESIQFIKSIHTKRLPDSIRFVLFNGGHMSDSDWFELHRQRTNQVWIMTTMESALASFALGLIPPVQLKSNAYNLVSTYHSKSDIPLPYGRYVVGVNRTNNINQMWSMKTELVAWMSSAHCVGWGFNRTLLVTDIAQHIPVHMYGTCGNLTCPKNKKCDIRLQKYKFFLSFENSCCDEYITEKFWNALRKYEAVPVVIGAPRISYKKLAPPNSFIHVDDFDSVTELTSYLRMLAQDKTKYMAFFKWREAGSIQAYGPEDYIPLFQPGACNLLSKLSRIDVNGPVPFTSFDVYSDLWFGGCFRCSNKNYIQKYINSDHKSKYEEERKNYSL